jgi:hypothetical protein
VLEATVDGKVIAIAERLHTELARLDPLKDRDALVWAHGFLSGLIKNIELDIPDLANSKLLEYGPGAAFDEPDRGLVDTKKLLRDVQEALERLGGRPGSSERTGDDNSEPDAPVPARPNKGPAGRSGGIRLPLPDPEKPM